MLFKRAVLEGIKAGKIRLAFRRWKKLGIARGREIHTAIGLIRITGVTPIALEKITAAASRQAGYPDLATLKAELLGRDGELYRIGVAYAGADPRLALRAAEKIEGPELDDLLKKLGRSAWAADYLDLVAAMPAMRAADLAAKAGLATEPFKIRIRKLKSLGLTESLEVGYRLSPRGKTVLKALKKQG